MEGDLLFDHCHCQPHEWSCGGHTAWAQHRFFNTSAAAARQTPKEHVPSECNQFRHDADPSWKDACPGLRVGQRTSSELGARQNGAMGPSTA